MSEQELADLYYWTPVYVIFGMFISLITFFFGMNFITRFLTGYSIIQGVYQDSGTQKSISISGSITNLEHRIYDAFVPLEQAAVSSISS